MNKIIWVLILLALTGCSGVSPMQHVYLKNYKLGEIQTAYIGEPIIRIRDIYREVNSESNKKCFYVTPSNDFIISGVYTKKLFNRNLHINGSSKEHYPLNDSKDSGGAIYSIFDITDNNNKTYGLMVDSNGKIHVEAVYDDNHDRSSRYDLHNAVLSPDNTTMIVTDKIAPCYRYRAPDEYVGNNNFELLYGGINNVTISITYREFTRDNLARPSFYQTIVYETSAKEIRFKHFKIAIVNVTNEKIEYKIIEDKLEDVFIHINENDEKDIKQIKNVGP